MTTDNESPNNIGTIKDNSYTIERYKYILNQISTINENVSKYLTLFQTLTTAIVGGGITVFLNWKKMDVAPELAIASINGLTILLWILTAFVFISITVGILSWVDYRNEEVDLLEKTNNPEFRQRPRLINFWRWYETYILVFTVVSVSVITFFVETQIIPLIK
ncbi:hypothetical protein [Thiothrix sp.]|uniref:hypothetical protein n=1 Tax=Thiothrix sp. TaxID=1032 RepID=UPI00257AAEF1|nr:hypothetical protein [Thiothrix sp.]